MFVDDDDDEEEADEEGCIGKLKLVVCASEGFGVSTPAGWLVPLTFL